jgi:hypothetical protein
VKNVRDWVATAFCEIADKPPVPVLAAASSRLGLAIDAPPAGEWDRGESQADVGNRGNRRVLGTRGSAIDILNRAW